MRPPKQSGLGAVYTASTKTLYHSFGAVGKLAEAGEYLSDGAVIASKMNVLSQYRDTLEEFGIDTSKLTPQEVKAQALAILDF